MAQASEPHLPQSLQCQTTLHRPQPPPPGCYTPFFFGLTWKGSVERDVASTSLKIHLEELFLSYTLASDPPFPVSLMPPWVQLFASMFPATGPSP